MPLLLLLLAIPVVLIALMPLLLLQRYRSATARRPARRWIATLSLIASGLSVVLFLVAAGVTSFWTPAALPAAAVGVAVGFVLGLVGLALTRWEPTPRTLHYTPNRWLILALTLLVSARLVYGVWRAWAVARAGVDEAGVVMAFGVPESMAAGATVIGYYLAYSVGLRWRIRKWEKRALRVL